PPALAVEDLRLLVVDPRDHLVADREPPAADGDLLAAESPLRLQQLACPLVQVRALGVQPGDHQRVLAALPRLPPVGDDRHATQLVVCRDYDPALPRVAVERLRAVPFADQPRRLAVEVVTMADHLVQTDLLAARGDRREEASSLDLAE